MDGFSVFNNSIQNYEMASGKKSFVLYADLIHTVRKLPKETRGALFLLILEYVNDLNPTVENDLLLEISFEPIKQQLKRDLKDWEGEKVLRSESGRLGGIKSGESRRRKRKEANEASASNALSNEANEAVNVSVTVNVNVTDIGADENTKPFYAMLVPEIVSVWKQENPGYHFNESLDYHAALRIAYQIAGVKKWKKADVVEDKKNECVDSWKRIAKFIMSDKWFCKMTLDSIAGDKIWQKIVVAMQTKHTGNGKMEEPDYVLEAREKYLRDNNK